MEKGYHFLRLIGAFYKVIALLCVLFAVSIMCLSIWASTEAITALSQYGVSGIPTLIFFNVLVFLFAGGFPAIFFWSLASLIDLMVNINFKVDVLAGYLVTQGRDSTNSSKPKVGEAEAYMQRIRDKYT